MSQQQAQQPFGVFRMRGGRYERPGLPAASAAELFQYERLVRSVAHALYLQDNPGRQRVPRGFDKDFILRISAIETGSVVAVLDRQGADPGGVLFAGRDWFREAMRLINEALGSSNKFSGTFPRNFPQAAVRDLAQLGKTLQPDEVFELPADTGSSGALLNAAKRASIAEAADATVLSDRVLVGQITGLRSNPQEFDFQSGTLRIKGKYADPAMWEQLHQSQGFAARAPFVSISTSAWVDGAGEIVGIDDVYFVELALPPDWADRVNYIASLEPGWLGEGSNSVTEASVETVEATLLAILEVGLPRPGIYPTPEGGIQLEWVVGSTDIEVGIGPDGALYLDVMGGNFDGTQEEFTSSQVGEISSRLKEVMG